MQKSFNKKILKKTIATILVFVMVFQFMPNIAIAFNGKTITEIVLKENKSETLDEYQRRTAEEEKAKEPVIIGELETERTFTEKHFLRSDGSVVASIFPSNIHYEKDGKFYDVDNTLEEAIDTEESLKILEKDTVQQERYTDIEDNLDEITQEEKINENKKETKIYKNKSGNAKINFTNKTYGFNLGSIESEGYTITWGLENAQESKVNVSNKNLEAKQVQGLTAEEMKVQVPTTEVEYNGILKDISIEYSTEPEHVKENIILQNKEAINNELKFIYDVGELEMKLLETKDIIIYDKTEDNVKFTIEAPFMYDNKLEFSSNIEIKLEKQGEKYEVTIIPNKEWLEAEERIYPITIDPSIITSRYYNDIKDTFIYSTQGSEAKGNAHILRAGNNSGVPTRSLIKFNLPELKAGDQVIGAYLSIFAYPKTSEWKPNTRQIQIDAHKITTDWNENTAIWDTINEKYFSRAENFILYQFDDNDQCKQYTFDITSVAKEWYTTGNNYGIMLKEHSEANNVEGNEAYFISADTNVAWYEGRPVAQIIYRNQTGLEDYLSYHVQDLGKAGTVYTNDYNGNLTWIHNDISTPGERFPVTITHVYNTNDKDITSRYGNGMRLNLSQTIELVTIGEVEYAEYTDEDGTRHYFTKEGNIYKDEDGLNLELTLDTNTSVFTMKDKGDNILRFERRTVSGRYLWHLKEIEDSNGNKITITFSESEPNDFVITKVTDGAGQEIVFSYNGYYLSKLTGPDGKSIQTICYSDGMLGEIKYPDGYEIVSDFENNLLKMLINVDGRSLQYEYYPERTNRVKQITERASNLAKGNSLKIAYSNNLTTFTDDKGNSNNVVFNDWGQSISVSDFGKGEIDLSEIYGKVYNYGTEGGNKNKLTLEGSLTKHVDNLTFNGSFEYDGEWDFRNWGNYPGSIEYSTEDSVTGGKSLKFSSIYKGSVQPAAYQYCKAEKGKTYTMSFEAKVTGLEEGEGYAELYYIDASGNTIMEYKALTDRTAKWNKDSLTIYYPEDATSDLIMCFGLYGDTGAMYYDNVQLEEGAIVNQYNMIENSSFNCKNGYGKSWTKNNINLAEDWVALGTGSNFFRLYGEANVRKNITQTVVTSGKKGDIYSISAWVYAKGTRNKGDNTVTEITVCVVGNDDKQQWTKISITPSDQWQFVQKEFIADHDYKRIDIYFCFYENINEVYVGNFALYKDHYGQSYQYDSKGNIVKTEDLAKQNNTFNYDGNDNLIKYTNPKGGTFEYQYDETYKHRLTKAISSTGTNYNFEYNQYGQATNTKITNNKNNLYIENKAEYTENGNYLTKIIDEVGNETTYEYDETNGNLNKITDAKGTETNYTYDTMGRIKTVNKTAGEQTYQNSYTYKDDRINTITHNGFNYGFTYDNYGNRSKVSIGDIGLITNYYDINNGNLTSVIYGNGNMISYGYDRFNRISLQERDQGIYTYEYDAKSNLAYVKTPEGTKESYTYDLAGRLVNAQESTEFSKNYKYDKNGNVESAEYILNDTIGEVGYGYDEQNRLKIYGAHFSEQNAGGNIGLEIGYDNLSRVNRKFINGANKSYNINYEYEDIDKNKTTSRISCIDGDSFGVNYKYDKLGNIKTVIGDENVTYYYDELNQLIRENNMDLNKTIIYEYDLGGNITSKTEYPYTAGELGTAIKTIIYTYENTNWKDQMTAYDGKTITYDRIGNPLTYNGNTYIWQNGRELKGIANEENDLNISYKYNDEGIRTEKTINGETIRYYLEGSKVIYEKKDNSNSDIFYFYDNTGDIWGLKYEGSMYLYLKNLQGDVIGILDIYKKHVVSYRYDSWGKVISIKDEKGQEITDPTHVGMVNPYRYRSYRYDTETGLYYLNSRYYNPEWGRFLNGDSYGGQVGEILTHNIYAYCGNNPINRIDPTGLFWQELVETFVQTVQGLTPVYAGAGGLALADGPLPFGDALAAIGMIGATAGAFGYSAYKVATMPKATSKDKVEAIPKSQYEPRDTIIYRYGGTNPSNLTPKAKDIRDGLSFSTIPRPGAAMTTINQINSTGIVYAVQDGPFHVSVRPVGVPMQVWIDEGTNSIWTNAIKSVVIKF